MVRQPRFSLAGLSVSGMAVCGIFAVSLGGSESEMRCHLQTYVHFGDIGVSIS